MEIFVCKMGIKRNFVTVTSAFFCCFLVTEVVAGVGSADFSKVVQANRYFVDKTMFIKHFLESDPQSPKVKVITAPTKFGKSTIIDMLKRFLSIPVDKYGKKVALKKTENYKLFCHNDLKICDKDKFVAKHMGKYPVIHVNYHTAADNTYDEFLNQLRSSVRISLEEHDYLVYNSSLFFNNSDKDTYLKQCSVIGSQTMTKKDVGIAFAWLTRLLSYHFGQQVIVLMDEYDAIADELLFRNVYQFNTISNYLGFMSKFIYDTNIEFIKVALVTGTLRVTKLNILPKPTHVVEYQWLGDHPFSGYYGFTAKEVSKLALKAIKGRKRRKKNVDVLDLYYGGYKVQNRSTTIYNMWSVIGFFHSKLRPESYWCKSSRLNDVEVFIAQHTGYISTITDLLITNEAYISVNISNPLDAKEYATFKKPTDIPDPKRLAVLLFELGFLTPVEERKNTEQNSSTCLQIPNMEIYIEFCRILTRYYVCKYNYSLNVIKHLHSAVDSFKFNRSNVEAYRDFYRAVCNLNAGSKIFPRDGVEFHALLFVILASAFPSGNSATINSNNRKKDRVNDVPIQLRERVKVILKTRGKIKDRTRKDLVLRNADKMAIIIHIKWRGKATEEENVPLGDMAKDALSFIFANYNPTLRKRYSIKFGQSSIIFRDRLYIGLACDLDTRDISMAFYCPTHDKEPIFIDKILT